MHTWPKEELSKIAKADDLHISPLRDDGVTYGTPTWIWSVAVDDTLYVRAYNGQNSRWYQAALRQKAGRIRVAGITREVALSRSRRLSINSLTMPTATSTLPARTSAQ